MNPLGEREVRVVSVDLSADPADARDLLDEDERARADRFHFPRHGRRFTNARAALRRTLGALLGEEPAGLEFEYGERGKPLLPAHAGVHFNLSHSGDRALIAMTRLAPVGVDLELHKEIEVEAVGRRTFSAAEYEGLLALPQEERYAAFFRIWTRKEAVVKARGTGFGADLKGFDVRLEPGVAGLRAMRWPGEDAAAWTLVGLDAGPAAAAALAVVSPDVRVELG